MSSNAAAAAPTYRARLPEDEVIYFVLPDRFDNGDPANDRGGLAGDRLTTGFDPTSTGFFHGGDLKGLTSRLDYIQGLGATAVWLTPIFKNKAVQGPPGQESAGYHGYWITDFTSVDPHLGTDADFKALVDAAHARGMKVYMDIVVNHTADVIYFKECAGHGTVPVPEHRRLSLPAARWHRRRCRSIQVSPASRTARRRTSPSSPIRTTPIRSRSRRTSANIKVPAWLNNPIYYHNRGDSTFRGESSTMGDFVGLDDCSPKIRASFTAWSTSTAPGSTNIVVDGFRIDTAQHVNPEFWQKFVPAMLARARHDGIPNFHIFGEVSTSEMDPAHTAVNTRVDKLPAVLDFRFHARACGRCFRNGRHGRAGQTVPRRRALRRRRGGSAQAPDLPRQP